MSKKHKNRNNSVQNTEETVDMNEQEIEDQDDLDDVSDEEIEEAIDEGFKNDVEPTINEVSTPIEPETSEITKDPASEPAGNEQTVSPTPTTEGESGATEEKKEEDENDEDSDEEITDEEIDQFLDNIEKVVDKAKTSGESENNDNRATSAGGAVEPNNTETLEELRAREKKEAEERQKQNEEIARLIKDKEEKEKAEKIRRIEEMRAQSQAALQAKIENAPKVPTNTGAIVNETLNARYAASNNNLRSTLQRKMSLNDLFNIYIKQRTSFFGLESMDDYKRIEEYLLNNKFYYNHTEIPETSIKQFLSRLKYNTNAMILILKK